MLEIFPARKDILQLLFFLMDKALCLTLTTLNKGGWTCGNKRKAGRDHHPKNRAKDSTKTRNASTDLRDTRVA